jgi:hypothetical protein
VPFERAAAQTVNAGALAAGGSLVTAPEVVVDSVRALDLVVPLAAEVGTLGEDRSRGGRSRQGKRSSAGKGKECRELHIDDVEEEGAVEKE